MRRRVKIGDKIAFWDYFSKCEREGVIVDFWRGRASGTRIKISEDNHYEVNCVPEEIEGIKLLSED